MRTRFQYMETILTVVCDDGMERVIRDAVLDTRSDIESKISEDPFFGMTYDPYPESARDPGIVRHMCRASVAAGVGPMAGVAGAVALSVAEALVDAGSSVAVVENGGDIAFMSPEPMPVGMYADHPIFKDVGFMMQSDRIIGICSSSRTVGPSVSLGGSRISTVFSDDVIMADCFATKLGNLVTCEVDLEKAVSDVGSSDGVTGCMACIGDKVAMFGDIPEIVPVDCSGVTPSWDGTSGS